MPRLILLAATTLAMIAASAHAQTASGPATPGPIAPAAPAAPNDKPQATWTVQAEDMPEKRPWTDPASISFKSVEDGEDSWDIVVAATVAYPVGNIEPFATVAAIRRTNSEKEQEYYAAKLGLKGEHTWRSAADVSLVTLYFDPSIGYTRTTTFKDAKANCAATPPPNGCFKQHEGSVRAQVQIQPFVPGWNPAPFKDAQGKWTMGPDHPPWFTEFGVVATPFWDKVTDAKRDATGVKLEGSATGAQVQVSGAFVPAVLDFGLVLRASVKQMLAIDRSGPRQQAFPANATLFTGSISYEFGVRSFESDTGWSPSIGVTYVSGDDPLTGRKKSTDTTFGIKLTYSK
uniref:Uncharacterized protein n=1 Tax=Caulobacter sp. (strain K31) TaxID=366602 RepID=B0T9L2_CAUSK